MSETVRIESRDFWVKVVEMLQENWAMIEPPPSSDVRVYFISDTAGVFDEMAFRSATDATTAL